MRLGVFQAEHHVGYYVFRAVVEIVGLFLLVLL